MQQSPHASPRAAHLPTTSQQGIEVNAEVDSKLGTVRWEPTVGVHALEHHPEDFHTFKIPSCWMDSFEQPQPI
jgi:hypothetical protein